MTAEVEAALGLWGLLKYLGGAMVAFVLGLLGWNVRNAVERLDRAEQKIQEQEVTNAEKFGCVQTSLKAFLDTVSRLDGNIAEIRNDIKGMMKK